MSPNGTCCAKSQRKRISGASITPARQSRTPHCTRRTQAERLAPWGRQFATAQNAWRSTPAGSPSVVFLSITRARNTKEAPWLRLRHRRTIRLTPSPDAWRGPGPRMPRADHAIADDTAIAIAPRRPAHANRGHVWRDKGDQRGLSLISLKRSARPARHGSPPGRGLDTSLPAIASAPSPTSSGA